MISRPACLLALTLLVGCSERPDTPVGAGARTRVLVLGLDGMDHALVQQMLARGELPHLAKLARQGGFAPLETTTPPQSPTAWSSFITGLPPGYHGIFDFVQRDPATLVPYLSTSRVEAGRQLTIGSLSIPLGGGRATLLRQEKPFWWYLDRAGIPATVIRIPAHFPPRDDGGARVLSDMGTPDLLGTYGTFTVLTTDTQLLGRSIAGGRAARLQPAGPGRYRARLEGPADPFSAARAPLSVQVELLVDRSAGGALVTVGDRRVVLGTGAWSDFIEVRFPVAASLYTLPGVARLYLKSLAPLTLYVSPLNIDPLDPALPISSPPGFAAELARKVGRYYTQGMPEDTKALSSGVLSTEEFVAQARLVLEQRKRMLSAALAEFKSGLLFFYFGSSDQLAHIFLRTDGTRTDGTRTDGTRTDGTGDQELHRIYRELDREVGRAWRRLGPKDLLLVLSDHGFGEVTTLFDLNGWLARQGYLVLRRRPAAGALGHIDWQRTQAYGLGLNGLYLNQRGRERWGQVPPGRRDTLLRRLRQELLALTDPDGRPVVTEVARPDRLGPGPALDRAPDLVVGYGRGFKVSEVSATGGVDRALFRPNRSAWRADHCGDHRLVPGVLFSNRRLRAGPFALTDIAPTVLAHFGVAQPAAFRGRPVVATDQGQE